jgi:addiction module HigA family antidote
MSPASSAWTGGPVHPGEILREGVVPALLRPKAEIARLLDVSRPTLYDILDEKRPITVPMAMRLGKLLGNGPELWINLQRAYDLRIEGERMAATLAAIPTLAPTDA